MYGRLLSPGEQKPAPALIASLHRTKSSSATAKLETAA
jgi:hypothetical protein